MKVWSKIKPVVPGKMPKTEKFVKLCNWLQNATAWTKINVWWRPVVLQKNAKKWRKFGNIASGCRVPQHEQKSKFDQDQTSSSWEKCKKWENFETLQLVAQCHSMNKNQRLIKIRPVVPEKNAKKWRKFGDIASGCRMPQHKQKSKFDQDQTNSS